MMSLESGLLAQIRPWVGPFSHRSNQTSKIKD